MNKFFFDAEYFGAKSENQTVRQFGSVGRNQEDQEALET